MSYKKFFFMMLISFVIMYIVMFLNLDSVSHYHTSITRIYMSLLMVAPMSLVMMAMMGKMYPNKKINRLIIASGIGVFAIVLVALRTQTPISDVQYMKAMIPHHSSAIMVSKNADLKDPQVLELAKQIIESQKREISEMKQHIARLEGSK